MKRRTFLISTGAAAVLTGVGVEYWRRSRPTGGGGFIAGATPKAFVLYDLAEGKPTVVEVPNRAHSFIPIPGQDRQVFAIEKRGFHLHWIDFAAGKVAKTIDVPKPRLAYGHARFTPDGKWLLSSQVDTQTGQGWLAYYD